MTDSLRRTSLLDRISFTQGTSLSPLQSQVDGLVTRTVEEAANPRTLAAMVAGGAAYRLGRMGVMALGANATGTAALGVRGFSLLGGLGTEVTAFEFTNRTLQTLSPLTHSSPNLWSWSGQGGWAQGLASSAITFGMLKGAGWAAREENIVFQHALQSSAMVAGHNTAASFGVIPRPEGSLAEQILHAEATNIQLGAGMSLLHSAAPGLAAMERSWDLSLQSRDILPNTRPTVSGNLENPLALAMAGGGGRLPAPGPRVEGERNPFEVPQVLLSEMEGDGGGGSKPADWPANIPVRWSEVKGSQLHTSREVTNTQELNEAIVEDGIMKMFGRDAVHSVFGYGSFPFFRDGKPEDIRNWDADKKPDYIIIGNNSRMLENLARHWGLSAEQTKALVDHGRFQRYGFREGFVFFNTDILIPGRGPVAFKISLVDENAFFGRRLGKPILEYGQIRLKDAAAQNLLYSQDRDRTLGHLDRIRDQIFDEAYLRMGLGIFEALVLPARFARHSFTGRDLAEWFYRLSFRVEGYRFWENGLGSWDKGRKLFSERAEVARTMMAEAFRRFALRHRRTLRIDGEKVDPSNLHQQITPKNVYQLTLTNWDPWTGGTLGRTLRYILDLPFYLALNLRGLSSYVRHGLPSNKFSQAYYVQPPEEYAGRKARNLVYRPGMTRIPTMAQILSHPITRRLPILKKIALDSVYYPIYYSSLPAYVNQAYRKGELNREEYDALFQRISASPDLAKLRNEGLLQELLHTDDPHGLSGAQKLLGMIRDLPFLEPSVAKYIQGLALPAPLAVAALPAPSSSSSTSAFLEDSPWEIKQMVEHYLTAINLLSVGETPRMYELLRQSIRLSLPPDAPRVTELIDYVDRSERGELTQLRQQVETHRSIANPAFERESVPPPMAIPLRPPTPKPVSEIKPGSRQHDELAQTILAPPTDPGKKKE